MSKPLDKPVKETKTTLYRDDGSENDGVPRWYRIFTIIYVDGSGESYKILLGENDE